MSSSGSHNAHEPSSNHTPEWVWLIVWMIVVAIALQATSGTGHEGNGPDGDVNCISGVQMMGCMP